MKHAKQVVELEEPIGGTLGVCLKCIDRVKSTS